MLHLNDPRNRPRKEQLSSQVRIAICELSCTRSDTAELSILAGAIPVRLQPRNGRRALAIRALIRALSRAISRVGHRNGGQVERLAEDVRLKHVADRALDQGRDDEAEDAGGSREVGLCCIAAKDGEADHVSNSTHRMGCRRFHLSKLSFDDGQINVLNPTIITITPAPTRQTPRTAAACLCPQLHAAHRGGGGGGRGGPVG